MPKTINNINIYIRKGKICVRDEARRNGECIRMLGEG